METASQLPLDQRQEIFRQLVERQDRGVSVPQSREEICQQFSIKPEQMTLIEREGVSEKWPPLS